MGNTQYTIGLDKHEFYSDQHKLTGCLRALRTNSLLMNLLVGCYGLSCKLELRRELEKQI